nr:hypothetical protein Q903MT_gene3477 [Picea sitchensis]
MTKALSRVGLEPTLLEFKKKTSELSLYSNRDFCLPASSLPHVTTSGVDLIDQLSSSALVSPSYSFFRRWLFWAPVSSSQKRRFSTPISGYPYE